MTSDAYLLYAATTPTCRADSLGGNQDRLPIIATCDACGACCMLVGSPPFLSDEWNSVRLSFPESLRNEVEQY